MIFPNTFLKKVIIIKARTTCPTVILATNRTANVIGRKKCLINSTIDRIGERAKVTPLGINLLKKFLYLNTKLERKQELHLTKANGKMIIS
jgi:hypothetical protein